jgi:hypothetical protein
LEGREAGAMTEYTAGERIRTGDYLTIHPLTGKLCRAGVDLLGSAAAIGKAIEDIDEGDTVVIDPNGPARKKR